MPSTDVNWLAVIVAAAAYFVLGMLWYGPLFGKRWAAGMGLTDEDTSGDMTTGMIVTAVAELVLVFVLASHVVAGGGMAEALHTAFWLWLGFTAATAAVNAAWDTRPWPVYLINQGHHLVGLLIAAAILALWP